MRLDEDPGFKKLVADLGQWMRDASANMDELKKQPDSPERREKLEALQNAALGLQSSLGSLIATANKKNAGGVDADDPPKV